MNTENDTDHEMEQILSGAFVETTRETDERILAGAGRELPARPVRRLRRFMSVAAAILLLVGAGFGAMALFTTRGPGGDADPGQAVANQPPDLVLIDVSVADFDGVAEDQTIGFEFSEPLTGEIRPAPTTLYVEGGAGGGGVGGRIRVRSNETLHRLPPGAESPQSLPIGARLDLPAAVKEVWRYYETRPGGGYESGTGEVYDSIAANPFRDPRAAPLSTFSVDVDSASYANVRRFLKNRTLPPADAVRIEELINYFTYDYPQPGGDRPFSVVADAAECPWNPKYRLVRIGVQGRRIADEHVPPRNLVFLLDVSGSMQSEDKLPLVKSAMKLLVGTLRPQDRVGIVTYASGTGVALEPSTGSERFKITSVIDRLAAGGSTNAGSGIQMAYDLARRHFEKGAINRVILATDGDFNVGITSRADLEALITKEREDGIFLTVLGVGTGNLKDSQMEMLADRGNGNYAYLDSILEAEKVLVREAGATLVTIARDVKIQVEFNPARVAAYRLVGYENRILAARDFNDDRKDAGEIGAGHSVTALFEIIPAGVAVPKPDVAPLRYQEGEAAPEEAPVEVNEDFGDEMLFLRLRYKEPEGAESRLLEFPLTDPGAVSINETDGDFAFAAAVAVFGKILRNAPDCRGLTLDLVHEIAAGAVGEDGNGDRREFLELVEAARALSK